MFTVRNGLQKLLATSQASQASQTNVRYLQAAIPAGDCVAVVARAIQDSRVLSFQYPDGDSSGYATYEVEPVELSEHFDAFYVSGNSSKNKGAWFERTFRISRIQEGSLEAGDPFIRQPDLTASTPNNAFSVARAVVAIRPGTSAPFARRGWEKHRDSRLRRRRYTSDSGVPGSDAQPDLNAGGDWEPLQHEVEQSADSPVGSQYCGLPR